MAWGRREAGQDPLQLLRTRPLVRYDRQLAGGKLADRYLQALGITPRERMELNSVLAVAMMVEQGLGVGLVPDIGQALTRQRAVCALDLPALPHGRGIAPSPSRELGLLWLNTSPRIRWVRSLLECARQTNEATPAALAHDDASGLARTIIHGN